MNAPAILVAMAIDSGEPRIAHSIPGIDRMLAVVMLRRYARDGFLRVFRNECSCGSDHRVRAKLIMPAFDRIHPLAIPALRAAHVPENLLREPRVYRRGEKLPEDKEALRALLEDPVKGRRAKRLMQLAKHIPVYEGDEERTRLAQVRFALAYARKNRITLDLDAAKVSPIQELLI